MLTGDQRAVRLRTARWACGIWSAEDICGRVADQDGGDPALLEVAGRFQGGFVLGADHNRALVAVGDHAGPAPLILRTCLRRVTSTSTVPLVLAPL